MQPYQEFEKNWRADKQSKFQALKAAVSFSASVSQTPYNNPQQLRNWQNFMLTHTEGALLVYDPEYEGKAKYAYSAIKKFQETHDYTLTLVTWTGSKRVRAIFLREKTRMICNR